MFCHADLDILRNTSDRAETRDMRGTEGYRSGFVTDVESPKPQ